MSSSSQRGIPVAKTLRSPVERQRRVGLVHEAHVADLTRFVDELRRERGLTREIPYFEPLDGGVNARVLLLLETPGPAPLEFGFASRDNPSGTAKNILLTNYEAGLDRRETVTWNIVPWYLGDGGKVRPAKARDIREGLPFLLAKVLPLLSQLECVVLFGKKSQKAESWIRARRPELRIFHCPHPSPVCLNRDPGNRAKLVDTLAEVARSLTRTAP